MAWRIDKIAIKNFKFFNDEFTLPVDCKNLLLYGENGSGKSSIYWSFYTMFQACLKSETSDAQKYFQYTHPQNLRNRYSKPTDYSGLKITFRNGGTTISFENSSDIVSIHDPIHPEFMKLSMASSDFMNYKFLASIFDFSNSQDNDIFEVLVKEVFPFINFRDSLIVDNGVDSQRHDADFWWKFLSQPQCHVPTRKNTPGGAYIMSSEEYKVFVDKLTKFNRNLKQELTLIFNDANTKLKTLFNEEISLHFRYHDATFNQRIGKSKSHDGKLQKPRIILFARMTGTSVVNSSDITHPRSFFNEARLTCMALALRLAFLDARKVAGEDFSPVIFMDDLLISLDMGCRQYIIPILLEYAKSKQMFIFTHDRAFFNLTWGEINKLNQKEEWKKLELYVNDDEPIVKPIMMESVPLLEKAKQKYKSLDLSGCANTLRSACESELKRILPLNLILSSPSSEDTSIKFNSLNTLITNFSHFRKRFFDLSLNCFPDIVPNLSNHRKLVMNPYSHDDIETPLYRNELKNAIVEVERLSQIKKTRLIADDEIRNIEFIISMDSCGVNISAVFVFLERFEKVSYNSTYYYSASKIYVKSCSERSIRTNVGDYDVRKLYKDIYEKLGFCAIDRPAFDSCIKRSNDGATIGSI